VSVYRAAYPVYMLTIYSPDRFGLRQREYVRLYVLRRHMLSVYQTHLTPPLYSPRLTLWCILLIHTLYVAYAKLKFRCDIAVNGTQICGRVFTA